MQVITTYEPYAEEPEYIQANRDLLDTLPMDGVTRVLDLACGTGLLTNQLFQIKPDITVNGVDLSKESLDIGRKNFRKTGILVESQEELDKAAAEHKSAYMMVQGSAMDLTFAPETFQLAMMGNAIHLMPDKDDFLEGVNRVLAPGGRFTFNSVFFAGTYEEGTEALWTEWLKEAVIVLGEKNAALMAAGEKPISRIRGKSGHAFDKGWLSPEGWQEILERHGFKVERVYKRNVAISQRGLELVGAYAGLAEVLMSGYPVEIASECLQEAAGRAFRNIGVKEVPRYWLEMTAVKV